MNQLTQAATERAKRRPMGALEALGSTPSPLLRAALPPRHRHYYLAALAFVLALLVAFDVPASVARAMFVRGGFDPTRQARPAGCPEQWVAHRADAGDWSHDCVRVVLEVQ